jgi:hypothetical protein
MAHEDKIINDAIGKRRASYPSIEDQLDIMWHDIYSGKFGEDAKDGEWFKSILLIKEQYPKYNQEI